MSPPIPDMPNGTPKEIAAATFFDMWCEFQAAKPDPATMWLGKMIFKLRDEVEANRVHTSKTNAITRIYVTGVAAIIFALWGVFAAHVFG